MSEFPHKMNTIHITENKDLSNPKTGSSNAIHVMDVLNESLRSLLTQQTVINRRDFNSTKKINLFMKEW